MKRFLVLLLALSCVACGNSSSQFVNTDSRDSGVPPEILAIMNKSLYDDATWSLRVLDSDTGGVLIDLNSGKRLLIASVRKLFSIGTALEELGVDHRFVTTVHRVGNVDNAGVLSGDLVLVAPGDVTMGMRRRPDETMAIGRIDHNEALAVGTATLTEGDARLAYRLLAEQVAAAGVTEITGEVIIDDRLFDHFVFREQYTVTPAFVNENFVDVALSPTTPSQPATLEVRPQSAAFTVNSFVTTVAGDGVAAIEVDPFLPDCIGQIGCSGNVTGELPIDGAPPVVEQYPIVQNFRITEPSNFARTVFIEELVNAGITVAAPLVSATPADQLPPRASLTQANQMADYTSLPFSEYARLVLKVSFNLGADVSNMQFGLSQGVRSQTDALAVEAERLNSDFGISPDQFVFFDGSGGGLAAATATSVTTLLQEMTTRPSGAAFRDGLPLLGLDGTLGVVLGFLDDPTLAGAAGKVQAKTGTLVTQGATEDTLAVGARAMAGYIQTRSGRNLTFIVNVNGVDGFNNFLETIEVNDDLGIVCAILWRDL